MPLVYITKHKAVLVHIPKTAGVSIRSALSNGQIQGPIEGLNPIPESWPLDRSFAVVRHPLDRFVSACSFLGLSPDEGVDILRDKSIAPTPSLSRPKGCAKYHLLPQTDGFNRLSLAKHVLRFEQLQDEYNALAVELGLPRVNLPKLNCSDHETWQKVLTKTQVNKLCRIYTNDFKQLKYKRPTEK